MKLNNEEREALKFLELNEDFDKNELLEHCRIKKDNKYLLAMYGSGSVTEIENNIEKYYHMLEFYLLKKGYYNGLKERYLKGIVMKNDSVLSVEVDSSYLSNLKILPDLSILLNTLYKFLYNFESLLEHASNEEQVVKIFNDFDQIMKKEIDSYKKGKISFRSNLIKDLKESINNNFERGSKDYQYMLSQYFTPILGTNDDYESLLIYNAAINEIDMLLSAKKNNTRN